MRVSKPSRSVPGSPLRCLSGKPSKHGWLNGKRRLCTTPYRTTPGWQPVHPTIWIRIWKAPQWSNFSMVTKRETRRCLLGTTLATVRLRAEGPQARYRRFPRRIQPITRLAFRHSHSVVHVSLPATARADGCRLAQGRRGAEPGRCRPLSPGDDARSGQVVAPYREPVRCGDGRGRRGPQGRVVTLVREVEVMCGRYTQTAKLQDFKGSFCNFLEFISDLSIGYTLQVQSLAHGDTDLYRRSLRTQPRWCPRPPA